MGFKVSITSEAIAWHLSKFGRQPQPVATLSTTFSIPKLLWAHIKRQSPHLRSAETKEILPILYSSVRDRQQKAVIGSLLMEYGFKLDLPEEKEYLLSLIDCGLGAQASIIWKDRKLGNKVDEKTYRTFLVLIECRSHRVKNAEKLVQTTEPTPKMALEFVTAYAQLKDGSGVDRWVTMLLKANAPASVNQAALGALVKAKMWLPAQRLIQEMTSCGHVVPSDVAAACVLAAKSNATRASVASVLSRDGAVLNSPLLRLAVGNDPRRTMSILLKKRQFGDALDLLKNYKGHHELALCCMILRSQRFLATSDKPEFVNRMKLVFERAQNVQNRDGRYVHFMLNYYYACRDFQQLWAFISAHKIASDPLISPLSVSIYQMMWRIVLAAIKEKQAPYMPFSPRSLLVATLRKTGLTPRLMRLMVVSLFYSSDLQGLVTLLEFAAENVGIRIDQKTLDALFGETPPASNDWREVAKFLCEASSRDFAEVQLAAEPLRNELSML